MLNYFGKILGTFCCSVKNLPSLLQLLFFTIKEAAYNLIVLLFNPRESNWELLSKGRSKYYWKILLLKFLVTVLNEIMRYTYSSGSFKAHFKHDLLKLFFDLPQTKLITSLLNPPQGNASL